MGGAVGGASKVHYGKCHVVLQGGGLEEEELGVALPSGGGGGSPTTPAPIPPPPQRASRSPPWRCHRRRHLGSGPTPLRPSLSAPRPPLRTPPRLIGSLGEARLPRSSNRLARRGPGWPRPLALRRLQARATFFHFPCRTEGLGGRVRCRLGRLGSSGLLGKRRGCSAFIARQFHRHHHLIFPTHSGLGASLK